MPSSAHPYMVGQQSSSRAHLEPSRVGADAILMAAWIEVARPRLAAALTVMTSLLDLDGSSSPYGSHLALLDLDGYPSPLSSPYGNHLALLDLDGYPSPPSSPYGNDPALLDLLEGVDGGGVTLHPSHAMVNATVRPPVKAKAEIRSLAPAETLAPEARAITVHHLVVIHEGASGLCTSSSTQ
ncbi:hypothetical protein FA13DRAFT_1883882 [Coprinellus micaceus]|uniref:Uncharacterized protein n=1 Tax=Coprinellus micaceus TaxID=71717 RepID=A0A4Y7SZM9_COPMI|nr:hypothetical protein FA13DRAFT_1883882 [Coprinellus micaceus]